MTKRLEYTNGEIKTQGDDLKRRLPSFFESMKYNSNTDIGKSVDNGLQKRNNDSDETAKSDAGKQNNTNDTKDSNGSGKVVHSSDVTEDDNPESNDKTKEFFKKLKEILTSNTEIRRLLEKNPELKAKLEKCLEILNNPDKHSPQEINWALDRIKKEIKGALFEAAVKEALISIGLDVADSQKTVEGESGATRPDMVATNNTDKTIILFGKEIKPGDNVYVECKCGRKEYMDSQLRNHLPNQLSGHNGISILITTSDMDEVDQELLENVTRKNDTTTVILDTSAEDVENGLKEV